MIRQSTTVAITYEELEKLFNLSLDSEIEEWKNEKDKFFEDPFNYGNKTISPYIPSASFQLWLHIPKELVSEDIQDQLRSEIEKAGWTINKFEWQIDERTNEDILYIYIKK